MNPELDRLAAVVRGRSDAEEGRASVLPARPLSQQVRTRATA